MTEELKLTERAEDVLFFAKYYSSPYGPSPVKPEHILLALLVVDPDLFQVLAAATGTADAGTALRDDLKAFDPPNRKSWVSSTGHPPLSAAAKHVVKLAADASRQLRHNHIGTEHLLLGLIESQLPDQTGNPAPSQVSDILRSRGFSVERITAQIQAGSPTPQSGQGNRSSVLRALPVSSYRPERKPFGCMGRALHRLRGLLAILLVPGC